MLANIHLQYFLTFVSNISKMYTPYNAAPAFSAAGWLDVVSKVFSKDRLKYCQFITHFRRGVENNKPVVLHRLQRKLQKATKRGR